MKGARRARVVASAAALVAATMLALLSRLLDWFRSLFWKEEMELTLVGLQYSGKTTFVNVIAVRDSPGGGMRLPWRAWKAPLPSTALGGACEAPHTPHPTSRQRCAGLRGFPTCLRLFLPWPAVLAYCRHRGPDLTPTPRLSHSGLQLRALPYGPKSSRC